VPGRGEEKKKRKQNLARPSYLEEHSGRERKGLLVELLGKKGALSILEGFYFEGKKREGGGRLILPPIS